MHKKQRLFYFTLLLSFRYHKAVFSRENVVMMCIMLNQCILLVFVFPLIVLLVYFYSHFGVEK